MNVQLKLLLQTKAWEQILTSPIIPVLSDMYNDVLIQIPLASANDPDSFLLHW